MFKDRFFSRTQRTSSCGESIEVCDFEQNDEGHCLESIVILLEALTHQNEFFNIAFEKTLSY